MRTFQSAVVLSLAFTFPGPGAHGQDVSLSLGSDAPAATLEDLDGNPVQILDFIGKGKPALIEFWASWCPTCQQLQPEMDRVHSAYGDRVNVVAIAVAVSQTPQRVKRHMEERGVGVTYLWDEAGEVVRNYEAPGTGIVLLFDGEGKVVYNGTGGSQPLMVEVEKLLGG